MAGGVLADTTAWVWSRGRAADLADEFEAAVRGGEIHTCDMVRFELLAAARNEKELSEIRFELDALADCPLTQDEWRRALDVYVQIGSLHPGRHRSVGHQDLLIAAAAEAAGIAVLHYDADYELIAEVTEQEQIWIAPRGSLG